jgi:hypothetical protein
MDFREVTSDARCEVPFSENGTLAGNGIADLML